MLRFRFFYPSTKELKTTLRSFLSWDPGTEEKYIGKVACILQI